MEKKIIGIFEKRKVVTLAEIQELLGLSPAAAKYKIKALGAVTSCNHNAKYYSLPRIIDFDENGLWKHKKIIFSQFGTLKATIIGLVNSSAAGMGVPEITQLLDVIPYSMLANLTDDQSLQREKFSGCYTYFSADEEIRASQLEKRTEANGQRSAALIPDALGVLVLVEYIRYPHLSLREISKRLNKKGTKISESLLHDYLSFHGILKKTPDFRL